MSLQTREQHIKRERATSNICTAQVLLAIIASMYAVYHGPKGIRSIAERIHNLTLLLNKYLNLIGYKQINEIYFDTIKIEVDNELRKKIEELALFNKVNFRYFSSGNIGISIGENTSVQDIFKIVEIFGGANNTDLERIDLESSENEYFDSYSNHLKRTSKFLTNEVFSYYQTETDLMRYIKSLENKDLSLTTSMIPLGSCTMKLNAASEMFGITWPEFSNLHPYAPVNQALGYQELIGNLEAQINEITGFSAVSFQPNSGAQGEYTGLMVIREFHKHRGDSQRNVVLIPSSAHGTNPASAVMAGSKVVIVKCDEGGNIDSNDLKEKAELNKDVLSAVMITYPSTHGVFEENIKEICEIIHINGGQVYMDGANLNAQLGLTNPREIGADVCHLNLHKTFCIPHGGGGPGMGPIAVAEHLAPFLPDHPVIKTGGEKSISSVAAAPWGSANVLLISYAYIKMMGGEGLTNATKIAILNANYIKAKLEPYYKVLYKGKNGFVGHELIFDLREFKKTANIEVEDVAKRLMDYSYHAPTVSFPVPGTLMVEPTESESQAEIDRFCDAMISIRNEIREIEEGVFNNLDNVLKNAPHTAESAISDNWNHIYSREKAVYPLKWLRRKKFWPSVGRVDNAYGDRNLVCTCLPLESYIEGDIENK
jgi:glycine dehydrogenase